MARYTPYWTNLGWPPIIKLNLIPKWNRLSLMGIDINGYQYHYYSVHGKYAESLEELSKLGLDFNDKKRYGILEVYFSKEEFHRQYPDLPICIDVGVSPTGYTVLIVGNIDRDPLPGVWGSNDNDGFFWIVNDVINEVPECK